MPVTAPCTTWHPDHKNPNRGHTVHTRNPIPRAWATAKDGFSTKDVTRYTPAQERAAFAYHEAGHAIAMDLCGVRTKQITKQAQDKGGLYAVVQTSGDDHPLDGLLVSAAAGHVAEVRFMREAGLYTPERAWAAERRASDDQHLADQLCREHLDQPLTYGTGSGVSDWEQASNVADTMLGLRWGALARLAEELILRWQDGDLVMPERLINQIIHPTA